MLGLTSGGRRVPGLDSWESTKLYKPQYQPSRSREITGSRLSKQDCPLQVLGPLSGHPPPRLRDIDSTGLCLLAITFSPASLPGDLCLGFWYPLSAHSYFWVPLRLLHCPLLVLILPPPKSKRPILTPADVWLHAGHFFESFSWVPHTQH